MNLGGFSDARGSAPSLGNTLLQRRAQGYF